MAGSPTIDAPAGEYVPTYVRVADAYTDELLARIAAEGLDWRDELRRMARAQFDRVDMHHMLARKVQAAYAAGVLAGPEACMGWLTEGVAEIIGLPDSDRPDPSWYAEDAWRWDLDNRAPVPENCATGYEPAAAPATTVRPGISGYGPMWAFQIDGAWWETDAHFVLGVDRPGTWLRPELAEPHRCHDRQGRDRGARGH